MNFLIINGHKYYPYAEGKLNKTLFDEIVSIISTDNNVQTTVIENGYNIDEETEKYKNADVIIYQTPMNWFYVPWSFKKYIDEVFLYNIFYTGSKDYGCGGLMTGKRYMFSFTCNSPADAFDDINGFFNGESPEEVISPLHKLHRYCAMEPIKTFFAFDVVHNPDIERYKKELSNHIHTFVLNDRIA